MGTPPFRGGTESVRAPRCVARSGPSAAPAHPLGALDAESRLDFITRDNYAAEAVLGAS